MDDWEMVSTHSQAGRTGVMNLDVDHLQPLACPVFMMSLGPPVNDLLVCLHWNSICLACHRNPWTHTLSTAPPQGGRRPLKDSPECGQETSQKHAHTLTPKVFLQNSSNSPPRSLMPAQNGML